MKLKYRTWLYSIRCYFVNKKLRKRLKKNLREAIKDEQYRNMMKEKE